MVRQRGKARAYGIVGTEKHAAHPVDVMINLFMGERNGHRSCWECLMMGWEEERGRLEAREVK